MKKLIAILLIAVMVMSFTACGTINKTEVSILWSGDGIVKIPNSLINSMERAMYIENISYKHYGANGDQTAQTKQATDALNAGCTALVVELVDETAAQTIVDAAKAKNVPVIFFNCEVEESVVASYDKCALVSTNIDSLAKVQGTQIADGLCVQKNKQYVLNKDLDINGDGKISYIAIGEVTASVEQANAILSERGLSALEALDADLSDFAAESYSVEEKVFFFFSKVTEYGKLTSGANVVELILTDNDISAQAVFTNLQAMGFNKDKLSTHHIPVFTVGNEADYKALVQSGRPEGAHESDAVQEYYKNMQYVTDMRNISADDIEVYICTTVNIISDGRIAGTVTEDYDSIAVTVASITANMINGADAFGGISSDYIVGTWAVKIPYTTVSAN